MLEWLAKNVTPHGLSPPELKQTQLTRTSQNNDSARAIQILVHNFELVWPKRQREMTKFKVLCRTCSEFSLFYLIMNCIAVLAESTPGLFGNIRQIERVETITKKFEIVGSHF